MKRKILWILVILASVIYITATAIITSISNQKSICKGIQIEIMDSTANNFIGRNSMLRIISANNIRVKGMKMSKINTEKIESILAKKPWIRKINCYRTPDSYIKIDVWQRKPVMRIINKNAMYYLDEDGRHIPPVIFASAHVIVASGNINSKKTEEELLFLAKYFKESSFWNAQIEQIYVEGKNNYVLIPRAGKHRIVIGDIERLDQKLAKLMVLYDEFNDNGWNLYREINLKYRNQIVCVKKI